MYAAIAYSPARRFPLMSADHPDDLIRPSRAARILDCHVNTVYRWVLTGKLPGWRTPGGGYLVRESDVRACLVPHVPAAAPRGERQARSAAAAATARLRARGWGAADAPAV